MKKFALRASALAVLALCQPVFASEIDDLKAEIAAQKATEAAQKARLDALEQRLNAVQSQQPAAPAVAPVVNKALLTDQNGMKIVDTPAGVSLYDNGNTSLHMYGLIEATGSHANHQASGSSVTGMQVAWFSGNRLGFAFGSQGAGGSGDVGNGGSTPGDFKKGQTQEASIALNSLAVGPGLLSANLSYDRANVNDLIHQSELIGGNYRIGMFRVNGGYVHYTAEQGLANSAGTRTDNAWTVSMSVLPTPENEFALGFNDSKGKNAGFSGGGTILNPFGSTAGVTATAANGSKKAIFGSYMYHVDRQFDIYVAADHFKVDGDWVLGDAQGNGNHFGAGQAYSGDTELAIGARYKF